MRSPFAALVVARRASSHPGPRAAFGVAVIAALSLNATPSAAQTGPSPTRALLMLSTSATLEAQALERAYAAELGLALENVEVRPVDPGAPGFASEPLAAQVDVVRHLLEKHQGLAATWISPVSSQLVLVHMVVVSSGRVLVRMIDGNPQRAGFAVDLAMASRELLGTAFLFVPAPPELPVARVVNAVRDRVSGTPAPARRPWSMHLRERVGGGVAGFTGPSILLGGELGLERRVVAGLSLRLFADARTGPLDSDGSTHAASTLVVAPGVGTSYLWNVGPLRVGPAVDLRVTWATIHVQSTTTRTEAFTLTTVRADLGPELRLAAGDRLEVLAAGALGLAPAQQVLTLESSGKTLLRTPTLAWDASIGVALHLF